MILKQTGHQCKDATMGLMCPLLLVFVCKKFAIVFWVTMELYGTEE